MSFYSNVTEQDLDNLRKLAHQQKEQRAIKIKNRILKQRRDVKLAKSLSPIFKKLNNFNESTIQLVEIVKQASVEDGNTQTPATKNTTITQSLRDTFIFDRE